MSPAPALLTALFLVLPLAHLTGLRNLVALLVVLWVIRSLIREHLRPPLAAPLAAWLLIGAASALWSPGAEDTLKATFYDIVLPAGAFYAAYLVSRRLGPYRILSAAVIAAPVLLSVFFLLAYALGGDTGSNSLQGRGGLFYYYPGPGISSTLCVYALPFALLLASGAGVGTGALGYLGLVCIVIVGIASDSRMFWPGAVAVLAVFWAWQWRILATAQRVRAGAILAVCAISALGMLVQLNAARGEPLAIVAQDNRPEAWRQWGKIAAQAPLLGYGLGLKRISATGKEKLPTEFAQRNSEMQFHAHNLLLNLVLQVGIAGLAVFMVLLGAMVREAWKERRDGPDRRVVSAALVALVAAMLTKNATDDFMHHAVVIAFWGYAGVLLGRLSALGEVEKPANEYTRH